MKKIISGIIVICWIVTIWIGLSFLEINRNNNEEQNYSYSKFNYFVMIGGNK
jgi:uncharacterized protein YxeA